MLDKIFGKSKYKFKKKQKWKFGFKSMENMWECLFEIWRIYKEHKGQMLAVEDN